MTRPVAAGHPVIPGLISSAEVDWTRVTRASYLVNQSFRYDYPGEITGLEHRLVVIPPERFGDQERRQHHLRTDAEGRLSSAVDGFGNTVLELSVPRVARSIELEAWVCVDRAAGGGPHEVAAAWLADRRLLDPTELTQPDDALRRAAESLAGSGTGPELASAINRWVYGAIRYEHGVTGVATTAAAALALGRGVCQDYAHVMITICRLLGMPARYVSGHLLGEGGTHAWVEVMVAGPGGGCQALPFDPTHGRMAGIRYVTVAVGRDFRDVTPTSGWYRSGPEGHLTTRKRVDIVGLEYSA